MRLRLSIAVIGLLCATLGGVSAQASATPSFSYDRAAPLDVRVGKTWHEGSATFEDLTFASGSGGRIHAELVAPDGTAPHPGVLLVHWLGDPKTTNLTEFLPDARALAAKGFVSLLVDASWAKADWFDKLRTPATDFDDSIRQVVALRRALDLLTAQPHIDPSRLAYVGHDFGAMYGAMLSAVDPRPKCYVLMAGVPTLSEWFLLGAQPKDKAAYLARMKPLDPVKYLARASARCFLFQNGLKDAYVPVREAESFAAAAPGERASYFYMSDHALAKPRIMDDRIDWLTARLLGGRATNQS